MLKGQLRFSDGIAEIYTVTNSAAAGDTPVESLTAMRTVYFENRTVGVLRYNMALQVGAKCDRLIAIPRGVSISPQDVVVIASESVTQYRVMQIQPKTDTKPQSVLLSLERIDVNYDIA